MAYKIFSEQNLISLNSRRKQIYTTWLDKFAPSMSGFCNDLFGVCFILLKSFTVDKML